MPPTLDQRVVLVTGAAHGIGLAYARAFLDEGYAVAFSDIDPLVVSIAENEGVNGRRAMGIQFDVSDDAAVQTAVAEIASELGAPLVLVNNAALMATIAFQAFDEIDLGEWDAVMAVNARGPFVCARHCLPAMQEAGWGRIINISSTTALVGGFRKVHYATSKGAVIAFTRAMAREVGMYGVTVNAVAPGGTESERVVENYAPEIMERAKDFRAIQRAEVPEDLVGSVLFLASEAAGFVTGQTLVVDGGHAFV